jgi:hypothetical protein
MLACVTLLILLPVLFFLLSIKKLCQKGTSRDLRRLALRRYLYYFILHLVFMFSILLDVKGSSLSSKLAGITNSDADQWQWADFLINSIGILMVLVRLRDPFVLG